MVSATKPYRSKFILCFLALIIPLLLSSCAPRRKAIKTPLKLYGTEYLLEQMQQNEFNAEHFSARFIADAKLDKNRFLFNGHIRLRRDSIIWISATAPLGVELFRVVLTPDSVKWLNRMTSDYYVGEFSELNKRIHPLLSFYLLQSLLLGNNPPENESDQFRSSLDNHEYRITVDNSRQRRKQSRFVDYQSLEQEHEIWLNPETFRITRLIISNELAEEHKVEVRYSEFKKIAGLFIATNKQFDLRNKNQRYNISLVFTKLDTEHIAGFPFRIPEKYKPTNSLAPFR